MQPADASPVRLHLASGLVVLAIFLAGALSGAGLYRALAQPGRPPPPPREGPPPRGAPPWLRELDLTAEQETQARAILDKHRPALEAILHQQFPRVRAIEDQVQSELRALLSPAQQKRLDEIRARRPGPLRPDGPRPLHWDGPPPPGEPPPPR